MPPGPINARFLRACRFDSAGSLRSAAASLPRMRSKSNPSKVLGAFCGRRLSLSSVSITWSWCLSARYVNTATASSAASSSLPMSSRTASSASSSGEIGTSKDAACSLTRL